MKNESNRLNSYVVICFFSVLMFLYLYNVSFLSIEFITTTRISLIVLLLLVLSSKKNLNEVIFYLKRNTVYIVLFSVFILWVVGQYKIIGGDSTQLSRSVYFFLYVLLFSNVVAVVLKRKDIFLYSILYASLIQSIFVIISFLYPDYKEWLATVVRETGNVPLVSKVRSPGFSNGASSALSLVMSLGVVSGMLIFKDLQSNIMKLYIFMLVVLIAASTIFVGRLGLMMSFYFFISILVISISNSFKTLLVLLLGVFLISVIGPVAYNYFSQNSVFEDRVISWAFAFFSGDDITVSRLVDMNIPELSINNIFAGNGIVKLGNGLNASGSDIGYIQTYYAVGLLMTFYFYLLFLIYLLSCVLHIREKLIGLVLVIPVFILELKEPFVFKYMYPFFVLTYLIMSNNKIINFRDRLDKRAGYA